MQRRAINPWTWQNARGFSQGWRIDAPAAIVFVAGQGPISPEGQLVAEGDFAGQVRRTFENMGTVLREAGASFEDVVQLTVYLTDMSKLPEFGPVRNEFIASPPPASTALGVTELAIPGMMVEVEAIACVGS